MNDLPTVTAVHGAWSSEGSGDPALVLSYEAHGRPERAYLPGCQVAAYEAWKEQKKVMTPEERTEQAVEKMVAILNGIQPTKRSIIANLITETINDALAADRQERVEPTVYEDPSLEKVRTAQDHATYAAADQAMYEKAFPEPQTSATQAREIVADWTAAHRLNINFPDGRYGDYIENTDDSCRDLEARIAAALAIGRYRD